MRGSSNKNETGSAANRRARKQWLLKEFGDGETCLCSFGCGTVLTFATLTVDRFPIRKIDGGTYRHGNIRPACGPCNSADGSREMHRRHGHVVAGVAA